MPTEIVFATFFVIFPLAVVIAMVCGSQDDGYKKD